MIIGQYLLANLSTITVFDRIENFAGSELGYVFLMVILFAAPRFFLRFGLPMALTSFAIGVATSYGFRFYDEDQVIGLFSTLGIVSLFLFAGMEVDLNMFRKVVRPIAIHIGVRVTTVAAITVAVGEIYGLSFALAAVLALALATPSTGFILDSIDASNLSEDQKFWIKLKAISAELIALSFLLILTQLDKVTNLLASLTVVGLLITVLPPLLRKFMLMSKESAAGSEFGYLLITAIIAGHITKKLGAYYLVGAFLVGIVAGQFKRRAPNANVDQMLKALRSFSSFFMPFYFFNSGFKIPHEAFSLESLVAALVLLGISAPVKVITIILHRKVSLKESLRTSFPVAISLMPNLVFGLVLADILKTKMGLPLSIFGGLIIYTLTVTLLAPLLLKLIPRNKDLDLIANENQIGAMPKPLPHS